MGHTYGSQQELQISKDIPERRTIALSVMPHFLWETTIAPSSIS
jgi:hypothetical protein